MGIRSIAPVIADRATCLINPPLYSFLSTYFVAFPCSCCTSWSFSNVILTRGTHLPDLDKFHLVISTLWVMNYVEEMQISVSILYHPWTMKCYWNPFRRKTIIKDLTKLYGINFVVPLIAARVIWPMSWELWWIIYSSGSVSSFPELRKHFRPRSAIYSVCHQGPFY